MIENRNSVKVTVIMAIYNCADTLEEALESLYSQTYKGFKIILCDDASTDNTYVIAEKYAKRYDNIVLLKNEKNLKLAGSLNHCLKYVDTEYVARMDGDDISLPLRFEKQIQFLDTHLEYAVVSCPMIYFDETGDWGFGKAVAQPNLDIFKKSAPHAHAPSMIRTSVMKEVDGYTDTKRTIRVEDYYLWYKIYKKGYRGFNLQEFLYKMRDDREAMARRTFQNRYNAFMIKMEVLRGLKISNVFFYSLPTLLKAFIPTSIFKIIRKNRMKKTIK